MIERYNRTQLRKGGVNLLLGAAILGITWLFFRFAAGLVLHSFWKGAPVSAPTVAHGLTALVFVAGVVQWARGPEAYRVFTDTVFHAALEPVSGGAVMLQRKTLPIAGIGYVLSQIFLAGPWQICTAVARFRALLPKDPLLEARMREVLGWMRTSGQWETAIKYRDNAQELGALIRCGMVEFSETKMRVKAVPAKPGE